MYSLVPSRPTSYLIKYNLFTTIFELSYLYTNTVDAPHRNLKTVIFNRCFLIGLFHLSIEQHSQKFGTLVVEGLLEGTLSQNS